MDALILWAAISATIVALVTRHSRLSLITLGAVGLAAYSVPAMLGLTMPIARPGEVVWLEEASGPAVLAMAMAWLGYAVVLWFTPVAVTIQRPVPPRGIDAGFFVALLLVGFALYARIGTEIGWAFFLTDRSDLSSQIGAEYLFWKWTGALGLLGAVMLRNWPLTAVFGIFVAIVMVVGDRTTPVIAVATAGVILLWGRKTAAAATSPALIAGLILLLALIFFAKPLYVSLKTASDLADVVDGRSALSWLGSWEAFVTHEQLERIVSTGLTYDIGRMVVDSLGQLLVVPSLFGIDSSAFNEYVQGTLFAYATYGLAYNFWAQCFAVGGYLGVFIGGAGFGLALIGLNRLALTVAGPFRLLWLLIGGTIAVYLHRNSLENMLAIDRQVVLMFALVWSVHFVIRHRPGATLRQA